MQVILGLSSQELWSSVIALCAVGLMFLGQDFMREDGQQFDTGWRWGDVYRRPRRNATWGSHKACACAVTLAVAATLGAVL